MKTGKYRKRSSSPIYAKLSAETDKGSICTRLSDVMQHVNINNLRSIGGYELVEYDLVESGTTTL